MALGTGYEQQECYIARALEIIGERWTLLIVRDCFYGVRRFSDLRAHLDISRAVLSNRLDTLVDAGVLRRYPHGGHPEYELTEAGKALWPTIFSLARWGQRYAPSDHPPRLFSHAGCGTDLDAAGRCPTCDTAPGPADIVVRPGAGHGSRQRDDPISRALAHPHRMLTLVGADRTTAAG